MEKNDMRDVIAELLDHDLGDVPEKINVEILERKIRQDWGPSP
jgi:hypothetical protein